MSLNPREKRSLVLLIALGLFLLWVYYAVFPIRPMQQELERLGEQAKNATDQAHGLEVIAASEASVRREYEQLNQRVRTLRSALPSQEQESTLSGWLSALASQSQVKVQNIFTQAPVGTQQATLPPGPKVYKDVLVQIDALAGYHQLGNFLSLIEAQKQPFQVANLRVSADPKEGKRHRVKLLLRTFFTMTPGADAAESTTPETARPSP